VISRSILTIIVIGIPLLAHPQLKSDIPIYPNAKLDTTVEQGEEAVCCSFSTTDPLENVVKFYETQFNKKALDAAALGAKYPAMKSQLEQMQSSMPPGFQYRAFVIGENGAGSPPSIFEVCSGNGRTGFSLSDEQLGKSGARFAYEFRKATGTFGENDKAVAGWETAHLAAQQNQFDFPVYPGSLVGSIENDGVEVDPTDPNVHPSKCSYVSLYILDTLAFDKVAAFYKEKLQGKLKVVGPSDPSVQSFTMEDRQFFWVSAGGGEGEEKGEFHGKRGDVNRFLDITFDYLVPTYPYFDAEQKTQVAGSFAKCIVVSFKTEILDGKCVELPK